MREDEAAEETRATVADPECRRKKRVLNGTAPLCLIWITQSLRWKLKELSAHSLQIEGERRKEIDSVIICNSG